MPPVSQAEIERSAYFVPRLRSYQLQLVTKQPVHLPAQNIRHSSIRVYTIGRPWNELTKDCLHTPVEVPTSSIRFQLVPIHYPVSSAVRLHTGPSQEALALDHFYLRRGRPRRKHVEPSIRQSTTIHLHLHFITRY